MALIRSCRGGGWYGHLFSATWPFCTLDVHDDHCDFDMTGFKRSLTWTDIHCAHRFVVIPYLSEGILIAPKDGKPSGLVFFTSRKNVYTILHYLESHALVHTVPCSKITLYTLKARLIQMAVIIIVSTFIYQFF